MVTWIGQQKATWFESEVCEQCFMQQTITFLLFKVNFAGVPASLSIMLGCDVKLTGDLEL